MTAKKKGSWTVFWWVLWITATIAAFFAAAAIWSPLISKHFGSIRETKASVIWVTAVFGTWIAFLVPLIIVMYQKVDRVYEDARIKREKAALQFRSIAVNPSKRMIPENLRNQFHDWQETIPGGHLVNVTLRDGRRFENIFIQNRNEVIGIYDQTEMPFEANDITAVEPADLSAVPHFFQTNWLRLDGVKPQV